MTSLLEEPYSFGKISKINPKNKDASKEDIRNALTQAITIKNKLLDESIEDLTTMFSGVRIGELVEQEEANLDEIDNTLNQLESNMEESSDKETLTITERTKKAMYGFVFLLNKSIVYSFVFVQHSTMTIFPILLKFVWYLFRFMVYLCRASIAEKAFVVLLLTAINQTTWGNLFLGFIYSLLNTLLQNQLNTIKDKFQEIAKTIYTELLESIKVAGVSGAGLLASKFAQSLIQDSSFQSTFTETVSTAIQSQVPALLQRNNQAIAQEIQNIIFSNEFKAILIASFANSQLSEQLDNLENLLITSSLSNEEQLNDIFKLVHRIEQGDSTILNQLKNYGLANLPALTQSAKKLMELTGVLPTKHPQVEQIEGGLKKSRKNSKKRKSNKNGKSNKYGKSKDKNKVRKTKAKVKRTLVKKTRKTRKAK